MHLPLSADEAARLARLREYDILDTPEEASFDELTRLAAHIAQAPMAFVSLLDEERQWLKARLGIAPRELPRRGAFCSCVVSSGEAWVVADAAPQLRFAESALLRGGASVCTYAGFPLKTPDGLTLGALCVIDREERELSAAQLEMLSLLAKQVVAQLELRRRARLQEEARAALEAQSLEHSALLQAIPGLYFHLSPDFNFIDFHGQQAQDLYADPALFLGRSIHEVLPAGLAAALEERLREVQIRGGHSTLRYAIELHGELRHYEARITSDTRGGLVILAHDQSPQVKIERQLRAITQQSEVMVRLQEAFIVGEEPGVLFSRVLDELLRLTESLFGFIGEVLHDAQGAPYLRTFAISNIAWSEETRAFYEAHRSQGLEFRNLETLFGRVLTTGAAVIANDPLRDARSGGLPPGHPPMTAFLGLPLLKQGRWVGMLGLANRPGGYDEALIARLEPFQGLVTNLIEARHAVVQRARSEQALQESEARIRAIVDTATDAILTLDARGFIERANPATARLFGEPIEALAGRSIAEFVPALAVRPWELGLARGEVRVRRADGSEVSSEVTESTLDVGGQTLTTWIIRDITERKNIERLQTEFVSTVSHELRTPLTSIRGALGLLTGGVLGVLPRAAQEMVTIALNNSDRLVRLINDILDIEKIESGHLEFQLEAVSLAEAVRRSVESNAGYGRAHGVRYRLMEPLAAGEVLADEDRLAQVLANLLSNAAKFSPVDEDIDIRVTGDVDTLRVSVEDRGPGVPADFRGRLFGRFAQADASDTRSKGGTGLGLSISRAIVERMSGVIGYRPAPLGGAIFEVTLPRLHCAQRSLAPLCVLVCESDEGILRRVCEALERLGRRGHPVRSAAEAAAQLAQRSYAALLLSPHLPGGLELLESLPSHQAPTQRPLLLLIDPADEGPRLATFPGAGVLATTLDGAQLEAALEAALVQPARSGPRLLHVEDDVDLGFLMERLLPSSWEIVRVRSIAEARAALEGAPFDLILLDLMLPDGDGEQLLEVTGSVPVVVFSAVDASPSITRRVQAALVKTRATEQEVEQLLARLLDPQHVEVTPEPAGLPSSPEDEVS